MNDLVSIPLKDNTEFPVNARDLHSFLGVKTRFNDWIQRRLVDYQFSIDEDYLVVLNLEYNPQGGSEPRKDFHLSIDVAKELSMVEKTDKGRQVRRYFIQKEKELRLARDRIRELEVANLKLVQQQLQIECTDLRKLNRHMELDIASVKSIGKIQSKLVDDMYKELRRVENRDARRKS